MPYVASRVERGLGDEQGDFYWVMVLGGLPYITEEMFVEIFKSNPLKLPYWVWLQPILFPKSYLGNFH